MNDVLSIDAIEQGFAKFETFVGVHHGESIDELVEAVDAFQESIGIDKDAQRHLYERIMGIQIPDTDAKGYCGWILCGIMLGLSIAEQEC